jgi:peptidoglycan/LPS O-acetylase OafA/YrhL
MLDPPEPPPRYHGLDALRAVMMLLGVLLHACQYYLSTTLMRGFDFRDHRTSPVCDVIFLGIHTYRMQVFFVMAGFFAALLCARRGIKGLWSNRWKRVGLPLILGWPILFAPVLSAFLFGCAKNAGYPAWPTVWNWWRTGEIPWIEDWRPIYSLFLIGPLHLWFLYALLWFYAAATVAHGIDRLGGGGLGRSLSHGFRRLVRWHLLLPALIGLTTLTLWPNPRGVFAQEFPLFLPNPLALIAYGPFFGFGWILYRNVDLLPHLGRRPLLTLTAAAGIFVVYLSLLGSASRAEGAGPRPLAVALSGSAIAWLCVVGFIGLFQRHFDQPRPVPRYVSDSAYWVYLAHLPLIYGMHGWLFDLPRPALVKVAIILAIATPLLLGSYDLLVRPTFLGRFLNGRTYPSALLGLLAGTPGPLQAESRSDETLVR